MFAKDLTAKVIISTKNAKDSEAAPPKYLKPKLILHKRKDELCAAMNNDFMKFNIILFSFLTFIQCGQANSVQTIQTDESVSTEISEANFGKFKAKVIRIVDGDTLEVLFHELPVMIRLAHIDCPEKKQAFGNKAKQTLSDLCFGQEIEFDFKEKDRNGRYICVIYNSEGINLNKEMIRLGMAWHFKKYSKDNAYAELENEARKNKIGLWQEPNPVAPWDWRK